MQLSKNFSFNELTTTSYSKFMDQNREEAHKYIDNLTNLAVLVLQHIRDKINHSITISSGFRGDVLNKHIGGASSSQHSFGEAADISIQGMSADTLFNTIKNMGDSFLENVGQVILEEIGTKNWVHVSLKTKRYKEILENRYSSTKTVFLKTTDGIHYTQIS